MHDQDFELDEFCFDSKQKYMGVQPVRRYYASLYGNANWGIENDSFDYAGTHCTHGQSGTCHLPDYAVIQEISLDQINVYFEVYDKEIGAWFEAEKNSSGTYTLTSKGEKDMKKAKADLNKGDPGAGGACGG